LESIQITGVITSGKNFQGGNHTALGDCYAIYKLVKEMATYKPESPKPKDFMFPPIQIKCQWQAKWQVKVYFLKVVLHCENLT
jgi:inhibitor of KinA sporulation pathway (predicted exonuclease)